MPGLQRADISPPLLPRASNVEQNLQNDVDFQQARAAGLKNGVQAKRIVCEAPSRTVIDGPFAETRELVAGFSIWEVKDMDEAVAWAKRSPTPMSGKSEIEIRPFYEAADLEFMTPEDLSAPRDDERGKLGVA